MASNVDEPVGPVRLIAGAMSGTSADGVDVAIVRVEGGGYDMQACLLAHHHRPYQTRLREAIFAVRNTGIVKLADLAELGRQISLVYAAAINEALVAAGLSGDALTCVAAHGQTLFHDPPDTIQWFDPALVAAEVGCAVVSDFRRADCAAGGQGAPLVPFAEYVLFRHPSKNRALVNIGGIANLTFIPAGADIAWVTAFDTGPGNCISDWLMRRFDPRGPGIDLGGQRALRGKLMPVAVERMLKGRYFWGRPPKSTDGPAMIELFRSSVEGALGDFKLEDLLATACRVTTSALLEAMERFLPVWPDEIVVSGGGVLNEAMMRHLRQNRRGAALLTSDELGVRSEAKEALAFALLGAATLDHFPGNVPSVTGARRKVVIGAVTPKP